MTELRRMPANNGLKNLLSAVPKSRRSARANSVQSVPVGGLTLLEHHDASASSRRQPLLAPLENVSTNGSFDEHDDEESLKVVDFLGTIEVFADLSRDEAVKVARAFTTRRVEEGEAVFLQGEVGHEIFFIMSGTVDVKILKTEAAQQEEQKIGTLKEGDHFGEAALLTHAPRSASIYAVGGDVVLKVLSRNQFDDLGLRSKMGLTLEEMVEFMEKIPAFRNMDHGFFPTVARAMTTRVIDEGDPIIKQGDPGHEIFFIEKGTVEVRVLTEGSTEETEVATLSRGSYFGEAALLNDEPRNASVYAVDGDVILKVLSREQFEQLGLKSKLDLEVRFAELSNGMKGVFLSSTFSCKSLTKVLLFLGTYCFIACLVFAPLEGWPWGDCVYFAIVTLTTVGYGDFSPKRTDSRIILMILVLTALIVVATSIGEFLEQLVTAEIKNEKTRKLLRLKHDNIEVGIFDKDNLSRAWIWKLMMNILGIAVLLGTTALSSTLLMGQPWIDALYFSFVTLTTIGYGDVVPQHGGSKIVVSIICLVGVPAFAMCLGRVVEIAYGKARNNQIHRIVGGLTPEKFNHLIDFCDDMWRRGAYNTTPQPSRRCEITPFEFLCFVLCKNEMVTIDDIKAIMDNFSELDIDASGILERDDLEEWLKRGAHNPASLERAKSNHEIVDHLKRKTHFGVTHDDVVANAQAAFTQQKYMKHMSISGAEAISDDDSARNSQSPTGLRGLERQDSNKSSSDA